MMSISKKPTGKKVLNKKVTIKKPIVELLIRKSTVLPKNIVENKYKVPVKLWKGFEEKGQIIFNGTMDQSIKQQPFINDPKAPKIPEKQWNCICWNIACCAAWTAKTI